MKKQYQIEKRRAVDSFQKWAAANTTPLQTLFQTAEMAELANASLGDLLRAVGKVFLETVMEVEVNERGPLAGVGLSTSEGPVSTCPQQKQLRFPSLGLTLCTLTAADNVIGFNW